MQRLFKHEPIFDKLWKDLGFNDKELRLLQESLLQNPKSGKVISKTNGIRKLRWSGKHGGKRGGTRVFYIDFEKYRTTFLLFIISKRNDTDLNQDMKKELSKLVLQLKKSMEKKDNI